LVIIGQEMKNALLLIGFMLLTPVPAFLQTGNTETEFEKVPTPWHLGCINILNSGSDDLQSLSVDIELAIVEKDINLYIAPFGLGYINNISFYGGLQCWKENSSIGKGLIFSRWNERNYDAIQFHAEDGSCESGGYEGDFISTRRPYKWHNGKYQLRLYKSGNAHGDPLPDAYTRDDLNYSWGKYEHSWIHYEIIDLSIADTFHVGALAFPGSKLKLGPTMAIFIEVWGGPNPVPPENIPYGVIIIDQFKANGVPLDYYAAGVTYNNIVGNSREETKAKAPQMMKVEYDPENFRFKLTIGVFQKNYGSRWDSVF
jgi:hypothetical protein